MAVEQIDRVHRLATHLGVEVEAAGGEAARPDDLQHRQRQFLDRVGELVRIPAILVVTAIGVDRPENAQGPSGRDLMLEGVPGQRGVVRLDIDLHFVLEAIGLEEAVHGRRVEVILMLGRLVRLRLDQDGAVEADLVLVLDDEAQEAAQIVQLALHVGVEQRLVTLATAPQHIIRAAQAMRRFQRVADLHRAERVDFGVRVRRATGGETRMAEQVGGAPEQLAARRGLQLFEMIDRFGEVTAMLGDALRISHHVDIVEAIIGHIQLREEVERHFPLLRGGGAVIGARMPGAVEGAAAEHVRPRPAEGVPEAGGEAEMLLHRLAQHDAVLVIETVGELVLAVRAFIADRRDVGEKVGSHVTNSSE